jgi:hypothetical protein
MYCGVPYRDSYAGEAREPRSGTVGVPSAWSCLWPLALTRGPEGRSALALGIGLHRREGTRTSCPGQAASRIFNASRGSHHHSHQITAKSTNFGSHRQSHALESTHGSARAAVTAIAMAIHRSHLIRDVAISLSPVVLLGTCRFRIARRGGWRPRVIVSRPGNFKFSSSLIFRKATFALACSTLASCEAGASRR